MATEVGLAEILRRFFDELLAIERSFAELVREHETEKPPEPTLPLGRASDEAELRAA